MPHLHNQMRRLGVNEKKSSLEEPNLSAFPALPEQASNKPSSPILTATMSTPILPPSEIVRSAAHRTSTATKERSISDYIAGSTNHQFSSVAASALPAQLPQANLSIQQQQHSRTQQAATLLYRSSDHYDNLALLEYAQSPLSQFSRRPFLPGGAASSLLPSHLDEYLQHQQQQQQQQQAFEHLHLADIMRVLEEQPQQQQQQQQQQQAALNHAMMEEQVIAQALGEHSVQLQRQQRRQQALEDHLLARELFQLQQQRQQLEQRRHLEQHQQLRQRQQQQEWALHSAELESRISHYPAAAAAAAAARTAYQPASRLPAPPLGSPSLTAASHGGDHSAASLPVLNFASGMWPSTMTNEGPSTKGKLPPPKK
jgi:hypothetical protein